MPFMTPPITHKILSENRTHVTIQYSNHSNHGYYKHNKIKIKQKFKQINKTSIVWKY